MKIDVERFRELFFEEAGDHLAAMEGALLRLETAPEDAELLGEIFRAAHSIKGASASFGLADVARFTHVLESLLERLRDGSMQCTGPLNDLLLRSADVLRGLVAAARQREPAPADTEQVLAALRETLEGVGAPVLAAPEAAATPATAAREVAVRFVPAADLFFQGQDPLLVLRELAEAGTVLGIEADLSRLPSLETMEPERCYLGWTVRLRTAQGAGELREIFAFVEQGSIVEVVEGQLAPAGPVRLEQGAEPEAVHEGRAMVAATDPTGRPAPRESSIRVSTEKVDRLLDLVGELVIAQSMITRLVTDFSADRAPVLKEALGDMERTTRELQERVMSVRMLPLGSVFGRVPRVVRDVAALCGKNVHLVMSGEEIELDKGIVDGIGDPLVHLIRNAVDHGIESPEERARQGKPAQGTVRLEAFHQGGSVVVEVRDDGGGLDRDRIRAKAIANGLIGPDEVLADDAVLNLVFQPGFSTAAAVTDVSGRGVGLDVVKRSIESLSGSASVQSTPGIGTAFRLRLPLTLAILDGLSLAVGEQTFIVPLTAIVESIRPRPAQVATVFGRGEVVIVRGQTLPLVRLHQVFGVSGAATDPTQALVVIVEHEAGSAALLVDELLGQQQVVIKSLETNFRKADGIMGATILGDGRVALILDVHGVVGLTRVARGSRPASVDPPGVS